MICRNLKLIIGVRYLNVGGNDHWSLLIALNVNTRKTPWNESSLEISDHRILQQKDYKDVDKSCIFIAGWTVRLKTITDVKVPLNDREFILYNNMFSGHEIIQLDINSIPFIIMTIQCNTIFAIKYNRWTPTLRISSFFNGNLFLLLDSGECTSQSPSSRNLMPSPDNYIYSQGSTWQSV